MTLTFASAASVVERPRILFSYISTARSRTDDVTVVSKATSSLTFFLASSVETREEPSVPRTSRGRYVFQPFAMSLCNEALVSAFLYTFATRLTS